MENQGNHLVVVIGGNISEQFIKNTEKWCSFVVGGSYSGFLKLKEGKYGLLTEPSSFSVSDKRKFRADIAKVGDVDWNQMAKEQGSKAIPEDFVVNGVWYSRSVIEGFNEDPSKDAWEELFLQTIESVDSEDFISVIDCEINQE